MFKPHLSPLPDLLAPAPAGSARDVRALLRAPLLLLAFFCTPVLAAAGAEPAAPAPRELERWLKQSVQLPNGQRLRVEVEIGTLNKGLKLAPCDRAEPFLPGNTRLWGRANVGLRCVLGARWTTYVPVKISAWGSALVARVALPAGRVPRPEDFSVEEVDWAASYSAPITNRSVLQGRELTARWRRGSRSSWNICASRPRCGPATPWRCGSKAADSRSGPKPSHFPPRPTGKQ
jgi:flagella basal body P-ring formation protein FlgA